MNHGSAGFTADPLSAARRPLLRFAFPLLALTLLIAAVSAFGYRSLSEEIRLEPRSFGLAALRAMSGAMSRGQGVGPCLS